MLLAVANAIAMFLLGVLLIIMSVATTMLISRFPKYAFQLSLICTYGLIVTTYCTFLTVLIFQFCLRDVCIYGLISIFPLVKRLSASLTYSICFLTVGNTNLFPSNNSKHKYEWFVSYLYWSCNRIVRFTDSTWSLIQSLRPFPWVMFLYTLLGYMCLLLLRPSSIDRSCITQLLLLRSPLTRMFDCLFV